MNAFWIKFNVVMSAINGAAAIMAVYHDMPFLSFFHAFISSFCATTAYLEYKFGKTL